MSLSTIAANNLLNLAFSATAWPGGAPGTVYFALFTSAPSASGGGTEVSGGSYARVAVAVNTTNFPAITVPGNAMTNGTAITFAKATAAWGTITYMGIYDAASAGNLMFFAPLAAPVTPAVGNIVNWNIADLSLSATGGLGNYLEMVLLNYLFAGLAFPTIANHYLTLGTGATAAGITGEIATARKLVANNTSNWPAASNGIKTLTNDETFAAPTAGTYSYLGIYNASALNAVTLAAGATTNNSTTVTVTSTASVVAGMLITGTGIPAGTFIASVSNGTTLVLSAVATATNTGLTLTATAAMLAFVPLNSAVTTNGTTDTPLVSSGTVTLSLN